MAKTPDMVREGEARLGLVRLGGCFHVLPVKHLYSIFTGGPH